MSEKTLKFNNIRLSKKEFHKSKELIDLMSVIVDQIVVSDKFIGYLEGRIAKPLCIILPQMSGSIKYFENGGKYMSFLLKDDNVWEKYQQICDVIRNKLGNKFNSELFKKRF